MRQTGTIEITDKGVIFVYHELPYPKGCDVCSDTHYEDLEEYEASKRKVEVSNEAPPFLDTALEINPSLVNVWNGLECEVEIKSGKAIITKIL